MRAWWSGTADRFLTVSPASIVDHLVLMQARRFRTAEASDRAAWTAGVDVLRRALRRLPDAETWRVLLEYPMLRLERRADAARHSFSLPVVGRRTI